MYLGCRMDVHFRSIDVLFRSVDVLSRSIDVQNIIGIELKQCTCKLQESTSIPQECSSIL